MGGIGSGKSVTIIKEIVEKAEQGHFILTNFRLIGIKNYHRLKLSDIIIREEILNPSGRGQPKIKESINWKFWNDIKNKYDKFSIFIDEAHYLAGSRNSMSRRNKNLTIWISQIRKVLGDSKTNSLYVIAQRFKSLDIGFRELTHYFILCNKIELCPVCEKEEKNCSCKKRPKNFNVYITNYILHDFQGLEFIDTYDLNSCHKDFFLANPYFKYYDSYEIVFGEESEYL
jgi:hypothetical protein